MSKTIIVCGHGLGISDAWRAGFGAEASGWRWSRAPVAGEEAQGQPCGRSIQAAAFPADLSDPNAAKDLVQQVQDQFSPVSAIHWNIHSTAAGDRSDGGRRCAPAPFSMPAVIWS